jgi:hypothetical protein
LYPISLRPRAFVAAAFAAGVTLAVATASALAQATVTTNHACYAVGQAAQLSGSGFAPSTELAVSVDGVLFRPSPSTASNGGFSIRLHPGGLPSGIAQHTDHVMVNDGSGHIARTWFTITRSLAQLTALHSTSSGYTGQIRVWGFSLNAGPREVYLHYVSPSGRPARTLALGKTAGACGHMRSKRELFLPFSLGSGTWTLQVDTRRSYARHPDGPATQIRVRIG